MPCTMSVYVTDSDILSIRFIDAPDSKTSTYGHSMMRIGHPVRSAIHKHHRGELVVWWVTTSESSLLYVLLFLQLVLTGRALAGWGWMGAGTSVERRKARKHDLDLLVPRMYIQVYTAP